MDACCSVLLRGDEVLIAVILSTKVGGSMSMLLGVFKKFHEQKEIQNRNLKEL